MTAVPLSLLSPSPAKEIVIKESNQSRATRLEQKVLNCPPVTLLYNAACKEDVPARVPRPWKIVFEKCIKTNGNSINETDASMEIASRTIFIPENFTDNQALASYIYFLIGATETQSRIDINREAADGQIEEEEFTRKKAKLDYDCGIKHHNTIQEAINWGWDRSIDVYQPLASRSFEEDYKDIQNTPSINFYRSEWRSLYRRNQERDKFCNVTLIAIVVSLIVCNTIFRLMNRYT